MGDLAIGRVGTRWTSKNNEESYFKVTIEGRYIIWWYEEYYTTRFNAQYRCRINVLVFISFISKTNCNWLSNVDNDMWYGCVYYNILYKHNITESNWNSWKILIDHYYDTGEASANKLYETIYNYDWKNKILLYLYNRIIIRSWNELSIRTISTFVKRSIFEIKLYDYCRPMLTIIITYILRTYHLLFDKLSANNG
jgi:hypothetical protein